MNVNFNKIYFYLFIYLLYLFVIEISSSPSIIISCLNSPTGTSWQHLKQAWFISCQTRSIPLTFGVKPSWSAIESICLIIKFYETIIPSLARIFKFSIIRLLSLGFLSIFIFHKITCVNNLEINRSINEYFFQPLEFSANESTSPVVKEIFRVSCLLLGNISFDDIALCKWTSWFML